MTISTQDTLFLKSLTVLYVEDDLDTREQFSEFLRRPVGTLVTAANGAEGLDAFVKHSPDIVITDILMPLMDGLSMAVEIRAINPAVPIIVVTAFEQSDYLMRAINIGVDKYVAKPVDSVHLLECLLGTAHRLRAEEQLNLQHQQQIQTISVKHQKLHEEQSMIFELSPVGILLADERGIISFANRCMAEMFACRGDELVGTNYLELIHPDDLWESMEKMQGLLNGKIGTVDCEHKHLRKDDTFFCAHLTASRFKDQLDSPRGFVGIIADVSERKCAAKERSGLEQQLLHAQKMELVGVMAGGIAHDINNVLTVINGYADLLQLKCRSDEEAMLFAREIAASVKRAADITRSILAFSGKEEMLLQHDDLNRIFASVCKSLRRLIREDITLTIHPCEELLPVYADQVQIDQVLINLVVNARDAVGTGGTITVSTAMVMRDTAEKEGHTIVPPGHYACMIVADSGSGMESETLLHIFEPFFTTKEKGKGTGLGLAIVNSILIKHNGYISVTSTAGSGTEFRVYLPIQTGKAPAKSVEKALSADHHGTETVLVVDDDTAILKVYKEVLGRFGYKILTASDGVTAVEMFAAHRHEIELVLVDVVMPGLNGREVVELIRRLCPRLPIIMTSGYTNEIIDREAIHELNVDFLRKPAKLFDLLTAIRSALQTNGVE